MSHDQANKKTEVTATEEEKEENESTLSSDSLKGSPKKKLAFPAIRPHQTTEEIFRERLDIWKRDLTADMAAYDVKNFDNPATVADCA